MIQDLVHPVAVAGRRLVNHIPTEVRLTPLPDEAWEGFSKRLDEPVMGVTGGDLNAGEASALELPDEPAPSFGCLSEGRQRRTRISR